MARSRKSRPPGRKKPTRKPKTREPTKRQKEAKRKSDQRRAWRLGYALAHAHDQPRQVIPLKKLPLVDFDDVDVLSEHRTLDEAQAALKRISSRGAFTTGLSLGLSIVAVLGVGLVLVYILFRHKNDTPVQPLQQAQPPQPPQIIQIGSRFIGDRAIEQSNTTDTDTDTDDDTRRFIYDPNNPYEYD